MYEYSKIILFGDAMTQLSFANINGWGAALANEYSGKLDVLNRGYVGYNTEWAKHILNQLLPLKSDTNPKGSPTTELIIIFLGTNDAALPNSSQHIPVDVYGENLRELINMTKSPKSPYYSPKTRVLLVTPPPLIEQEWEKMCSFRGISLDRKSEVTKIYAQKCKDIGQEMNVPVVDLWKHFTKRIRLARKDRIPGRRLLRGMQLKDYFLDGIHFSDLGNNATFCGIFATIKKHWPELDPEKIPMVLPWWDDINIDNPASSIRFPPHH
ncbi:isoamyl acetate-hydrolyzing esterase 1 [Basidiobolus meristosporus CBS 931.73]|uniref:Isoamyl acetate-hydrolyzing esterase 1 n=1 Tax=Basidiobolus meristosporus CBS 931.73 TaxID=1314790 RepID=A0A1Y1Z5D2_9FUNG|nr:isoamyl acetate-hydrolyzing esterase 1 [Basidiobolus meristosporus CBS 931.73]|eukprot:ORY05459.1 isoamyl acetate-hydrolyzing esterase 1 [Basidiobolus meristosporus CBS 931.73]